MRKPFTPEQLLIDEHATKGQLPLQETRIRGPRICTVFGHERKCTKSELDSWEEG